MVDIKQALYDSLTLLLPQLTNVAKVRTYLSTDKIIEDAEKLVFTDSALAIGDLISDKGFFSTGYDKNEIDVTIYLLLKNQSARDLADDNIRVIKEHLRNQRLLSSTIVTSHVSEHGQPIDITNRVSYIEINWHVVQLEPISPAIEEALDEFLRNATGLTPGDVLTAIGDSTYEFLPHVTSLTTETPTGAIDGVNKQFTITKVFIEGSALVYLNGLKQIIGAGNDYIEDPGFESITFEVAPKNIGFTDTIEIIYQSINI